MGEERRGKEFDGSPTSCLRRGSRDSIGVVWYNKVTTMCLFCHVCKICAQGRYLILGLSARCHYICPISNEAYIQSPSKVDQPITVPDRHSKVPAQLKNQTWKGVSSGGLERPLVNLCQQYAGKVNLQSCY
ncbi:hypothetical protein H5410_050361 [Solanum commersonii]|uniref:Uncharacterized protein n=1 Tax=Solanum commersonii TaxID=4109 RepID=A0A9J5WXR1_SOLCO|nr:hypothetical protein H5410_050361 [Solanum commersonii]